MDTTAAIKQLYAIVARQNEAITKLAQMAGAMPAAAPAVDDSAAKTKALQDKLFADNPGIQRLFIEPPTVLTSDAGGRKVVSFRFHSGKNDVQLKAAVAAAADAVCGAGSYLLQGVGQAG